MTSIVNLDKHLLQMIQEQLPPHHTAMLMQTSRVIHDALKENEEYWIRVLFRQQWRQYMEQVLRRK